ncbi:MAG TPA: response regulator [Pyrinomonadaceae bacterium]
MFEETNPNSPATIFLVEEDGDTRTHLTHNLRRRGYRLLVAADLKDAFEWMSGQSPIHADLVLIDLIGKSVEEALSIGQRLRSHAKYDGHTPLVVLPEKIPQELEGRDDKVNGNDWVCYYEDSAQLHKLLDSLLDKTPRGVEIS